MKVIKPALFIPLFAMSFSSYSANSELEALKEQINLLNQRLLMLEEKLAKSHTSMATSPTSESSYPDTVIRLSTQKTAKTKNSVRLYATLRPTIGLIDESDEDQVDVRDALSHVGFKATREFMDGWVAEAHGEWGIDLSNEGEFGKARRAYVALGTPYGRVGIGRQRPAQYLFIAEYSDIFNHGSSPFAYDPESIFFVDNLLTYRLEGGPFTFLAVSQFDGASGDDYSDLFNAGVSYDKDGSHLAVTYLTQDAVSSGSVVGEDEIWAASIAQNFDNGLYMALGYQDREYDRDIGERDGHTLDFSTAYWLSDQYRIKLGYFDFDDGIDGVTTNNFDGFNTTLEWIPSEKLRFHLEYLSRRFEERDDFDSLSVGFRYDLSETWHY